MENLNININWRGLIEELKRIKRNSIDTIEVNENNQTLAVRPRNKSKEIENTIKKHGFNVRKGGICNSHIVVWKTEKGNANVW